MVSFIIPVYNGERYLEACLDSILGQSLEDWEAILINDGSKDHSLAIMERYAGKDKRFTVLTQENQGISVARNQGLTLAKGDYVWFFDCDDTLVSTAAETLYRSAVR